MKGKTTTRDRIVSLFIWIVAGGFLVLMLPLLTLCHRVFGPDRVQFLDRFYARTQLALTFNERVHHVHPDVDPSIEYIFIQNHTSHLDHVVLYT
ncbi:MAG: hypothetical protein WBN70_01950, partial [Polyangiales bacterium]